MSLALSGDTIAYLMGLGLDAEQMKGLVDRLQRDAVAMSPPAMTSGINEERERLRNQSTYAERKRAKDRERRAREREELRKLKAERESTSTTLTTPGEATATAGDNPATTRDPEPSRTCTRVVIPSSSLRSEGTQEANASFVDASTPAEPKRPPTKPPKSQRGTRLPDDWEPSAEEFDLGRDAGLTDEEIHRAVVEFRNYWCSRSRDATKLSWRLTWHNRVNELGDRKRERSARLVAAPSQPGGGRRGSSTFADIYARRHGAG